jgi:ketosteroid isomerase-like protein
VSAQLELGLRLVSALNHAEHGRIGSLCAPGATWWIDTGPDRAAGGSLTATSPAHPWPLHGTVDLEEKLRWLECFAAGFGDGYHQSVWRSIVTEQLVLLETQGFGAHRCGINYENRHALVVRVARDRIVEVREYLDTRHALFVLGGPKQLPRTVAPRERAVAMSAVDEAGAAALALLEALDGADPDRIAALTTSTSTWWSESGRDRAAGRPDATPNRRPARPMVGRTFVTSRLPLLARSRPAEHRPALVARRMASAEGWAFLEAAGDVPRADGRRYQNRYCFVVGARDRRIHTIREYCDTAHAHDILTSATS